MASGVFGTAISEETVRATGEYKEPITQKDVADYAMKMINAADADAQKFVDNLKERYGDGISAKCLMYNATGATLSFVTYKDWHGHIYDTPYPSDIQNGQWGAFLHVHPSWLAGSAGAVVYRTSGVCDWLFSWSIPYVGDNRLHRQEVEKLKGLKFKSYADRQKYLKDTKDACDKVSHIIESTKDMITQTEAEKDVTKQDIAKDVYEYCTKGIGISLQFIRSYHTRLTYLDKLKSHSDYLIEQLKWLNPATQQKEAQRLALEAGMYNKATLDIAKKFQHFIPNQFSKWLKENGIKFEDLVQSNMAKLGFTGPFKNLDDIQKLQVYESIIEEAGQGKSVVTHTSEALGKLGVAFLVFTAAAMVWDIYTAEDKLQAAVTDAVNALTAVVDLEIGEVVNAAVEAGFVAADIEIASAAVTVIGAVAGFGIGVIIGMATGAMLDLIFSSGTSKVKITDGLTGCCVSPMPEGLPLARLVKHNFPDL